MRRNSKQVKYDITHSYKKSNELSLSKLSKGLTLNQTQLLSFAIFNTQKNNENTTKFYKSDFEIKFSINDYKTAYAKEDISKISRLGFSTEDLGKDYFKFYNLFQSVEYNEGEYTFVWSNEILPHIINLNEKYVLTDLRVSSNFKSNFSWILYDYLRALYGYWYIYLTKQELINLFNVEGVKSYQKHTGLFRERVIDKAISEINEHTELQVKAESVKKGKSIVGFEFSWSRGEMVREATEPQILQLSKALQYVKDNEMDYINLDNSQNSLKAIKYIKEIESFSKYTETPTGITEKYMNEILEQVDFNISLLENMLRQEKENILAGDNDDEANIPLFNWLEPDKKIEFGK